MPRTVSTLFVAVVLILVAYALGRTQDTPPAYAAVSSPGSIGRFQVVDPTPEISRNIMLVDTATGATWMLCQGKDGTVWCIVPRTESMTSPPEPQ